MSMFNIAIINGDGYSEILTAAAKKVLTAVSEKFDFSPSTRALFWESPKARY